MLKCKCDNEKLLVVHQTQLVNIVECSECGTLYKVSKNNNKLKEVDKYEETKLDSTPRHSHVFRKEN